MDGPVETEETVFAAALQFPTRVARAAYLDHACRGRPELRARVEALLHASDEAGTLLDTSPPIPNRPRDSATDAAAAAAVPPLRFTADEGPGTRIGPYELLQQIGEGGCGTVFSAEQSEPVRRRVALKVIKLGMDTRLVVARFEAERQALAMMDHPNIAKVLDAGATGLGRPYFVMELVDGIPITRFCDEHALDTKRRLELFILVCQAIQHAHQKGIIHRDIKPSNILVTLRDGVPTPKVIDFGIAKATEGRLTTSTFLTSAEQFIGTPAYMSPEQAQLGGMDIDTRSDIYSLGVLLYELLTGRMPFDVDTLLARGFDVLRRTIREEEPVRPSTRVAALSPEMRTTTARHRSAESGRLCSQLRGDLDWIVMKCLEKDRTRRYETANGLAADLKRHLNHEPVVARPPSKLYEFQKTVRRHRFGFAATAAVIVTLAAGLSLATWQYVEKKRAYTLAVAAGEKQVRERQRAERMFEESLQRAVRLNTAYGVRLMEAGDLLSSLQWFTEALRLDERDPGRAGVHRTRIGAVLRQCPRLAQFWVFDSPVEQVEFSPDGRWILTGHTDGHAQVWDARTGQRVGPPLQHSQALNGAAFSPDGRRVVTASADKTAQVWDVATGQPAGPPLLHPGPVAQAVFDSEGRRVLVGGEDGTARIWELSSGQALTPPMQHDQELTAVGFSPDCRRVVTASVDGTARVWDATTGGAVTPLMRHQERIDRASFSPDGRRVVTASRDGTARLWDAATGEPLTPPLRHTTWLTDAQFNPDNSTVATASFDNTARLWDVETGKPVTSPLRHGHSVMRSRFSPDGRLLITACFNQSAQVWDASTGELVLSPLKHSGYVSQALFSPEGRRVLTCGYDRTMRLWELPTRTAYLARLDVGDAVVQLAFSVDGQRLATAATNGVIQFWDPETARLLPTQIRDMGGVRRLVFSPDDRNLLVANGSGDAQLFNVLTGMPAGRRMELGRPVDVVAFSLDARRVILGAHSGLIRAWDTVTGEPVSPPLQFTNSARLLSFSRDGARVVAVFGRETAQVWDTRSAQPLSPAVKHPADVFAAEFSPDGNRVVISCSDPTLTKRSAHVWDAVTGLAIGAALQHEDGIEYAAFSPDGRSIVTASEDGTAAVWEAETGRLRTPFLRHNYQVHHATFSPDGRFVATASRDMTARVWDAITGEPVTPPLTHAERVSFVAFNTDGRLATRSREGRAYLWDLSPQDGTVAALESMGELLNSRRIDASGASLPVDTATLEALWRQGQTTSIRSFGTQSESLAAWHGREADASERDRRWFSAVFHLRRLLALEPQNLQVKARLTLAEGAMKREAETRKQDRIPNKP